MNAGESFGEAVIREVYEETGLRLKEVEKRGVLRFYFGVEDRVSWLVHVFLSTSFEGEIESGEEGALEWVPLDKIPFDDMWADDRVWVPVLLQGKRFEGDFYFDKDAQRLLHHRVTVLA